MINISRCKRDFGYYAANCLKIKSGGKTIPLLFNDPQRRIHRIVTERERERELQRYIILKARHEGVSTYFEARNFWRANMFPNTRSMIMAHEKESAVEIFQMCRLFLEELPDHMIPMTKYSSKKEILFANPDPKTAHIEPGLRSSIKVLTAGKDTVGRGFSFDCGGAHFSEVAFYPTPEDTIDGVLSIIPLNPSVIVAFESTANGVSNYFYDEWMAAEAGESNFFPIFLPWFELSEYSFPFKTQEAKDYFLNRLKSDEQELVAKYNLTAEQLLWRRIKKKDTRRRGGKKFEQEFPATPNEAFILSGVPIFDRDKLKLIYQQCKDPIYRGQITTLGFIPDEKGELRIWEKPVGDATYIMGVDASGGTEVGDSACIEILKVLKPPLVAQQVAEWHGKIDSVQLAGVVKALGEWYNEALVAIEVYPSAHGAVTQATLLKEYYNLYRAENLDRYNISMAPKYGWETTMRTKPVMTSFCVHAIGTTESPSYVVINSKDLIRQMMTFIKEGTAGAASGSKHDDRVIAYMIALYVLHETTDHFADEDVIMKEPKSNIIVPKNYIDPDWEKIKMSLAGMTEMEMISDWADY